MCVKQTNLNFKKDINNTVHKLEYLIIHFLDY